MRKIFLNNVEVPWRMCCLLCWGEEWVSVRKGTEEKLVVLQWGPACDWPASIAYMSQLQKFCEFSALSQKRLYTVPQQVRLLSFCIALHVLLVHPLLSLDNNYAEHQLRWGYLNTHIAHLGHSCSSPCCLSWPLWVLVSVSSALWKLEISDCFSEAIYLEIWPHPCPCGFEI